MFEDFSFSPSTKPPRPVDDDRLMVDCDSSLISPLSSRCPSPPSSSSPSSTSNSRLRTLSRPRSLYFRSPPPTSVPYAYDQKRLSIATLTKKLHEHTLRNNSVAPDENDDYPPTPKSADGGVPQRFFPGYFLTPPDTDHEEDSSSLTSPSLPSIPQSPFLSPTSVPAEYQPAETLTSAPAEDNIRTQRQRITALQCNSNPTELEALRHALLTTNEPSSDSAEDECHPSSLPPQLSPRRRAVTFTRSRSRPMPLAGPSLAPVADRGRRKSSSGVLSHASHGASHSHRIEKCYQYHPTSARELRKKSEQGLRRKSLVSAALASMVERRDL